MPATKNTTKTKATSESGVTYISSTGNYYIAPDINADTIRDIRVNVYAKGLALKQKNLIFSDKFWLEVLDSNGNQDEDLELEILKMCNAPNVQLWPKIQIAWMDYFWYGCGLFNDVWDYDNNIYTLQKLRYLPAESFDTAPFTTNGKVYSQILQGITLNESKEIEYYQVQDDLNIPTKVDHVWMIKEPTATALAGEPVILPLIPIISMLKYSWDKQMQQVNRVGAKILFIKVTDPQAASSLNGNVSDMEAAKDILKYWGTNTAFPLRGNMEIIDPQIKDDSNNLQIIEALNQMLIDYISPINFLTASNDSARLGGSDSQRMGLILRYINSVHSWLEDGFSSLLQIYLDANGYEDYSVKVVIPAPEMDTSEIDIQRAKEGREGKTITANEHRLLLGEEELTDEELLELEDYYKRIQPAAPTFGFAASALPVISKTDTTDNPVVEESIEELETVGKRLSKGLLAAIENEV